MHEREFVVFFQTLDQVLVAFPGEALTERHTAGFATQTPLLRLTTPSRSTYRQAKSATLFALILV